MLQGVQGLKFALVGKFDVTHQDIKDLILELGGSVVNVLGDGPFDVLVYGSNLTTFGQNTVHRYKSGIKRKYQGVTVLSEPDLESLLRFVSGKTQTKIAPAEIKPADIAKGYGEW